MPTAARLQPRGVAPTRPIHRGHRLRVEPIRQEGPTGCTAACLRMLLRYYGRDAEAADLERQLFHDSAGCCFNTDLARIARGLGLAAECHGYNLYLNDPSDAALTPGELLARFEATRAALDDRWYAPMLDSIVGAIRDGVVYSVRRPAWGTVASFLRRDIPVIAVVNYAALHGERGNPFSGHDVLVTGYEGRKVFLVDPLHGVEQRVDRDQLMFAIASRSAIGTSEYLAAFYPPSRSSADLPGSAASPVARAEAHAP